MNVDTDRSLKRKYCGDDWQSQKSIKQQAEWRDMTR